MAFACWLGSANKGHSRETSRQEEGEGPCSFLFASYLFLRLSRSKGSSTGQQLLIPPSRTRFITPLKRCQHQQSNASSSKSGSQPLSTFRTILEVLLVFAFIISELSQHPLCLLSPPIPVQQILYVKFPRLKYVVWLVFLMELRITKIVNDYTMTQSFYHLQFLFYA